MCFMLFLAARKEFSASSHRASPNSFESQQSQPPRPFGNSPVKTERKSRMTTDSAEFTRLAQAHLATGCDSAPSF
jgi:hypothetical protein